MSATNQTLISAGGQQLPAQQNPEENPENEHSHTLDEVQRRACRIHRRHGGVYGGYTLGDWLEAEHELEDEDQSTPVKKDHIH